MPNLKVLWGTPTLFLKCGKKAEALSIVKITILQLGVVYCKEAIVRH